MNIFLTGEINCGKSTLLNEFLSDYKGTIGGYKTLRINTDEDVFFGIYLLDINEPPIKLDSENRVGDCFPDKSLVRYEDVFNTLGVEILSDLDDCDLIVMDEVGILERDCEPFKQKIFDCLDSAIHVLGIIKKKDSPFLNEIRARQDVIIVEITGYNNNQVLNKLKKIFRQ